MTLIIEDGTGKPDAESYASAEDLAMYAVKFGVSIPAEVPAQEALLRRAALAMDGMTWKGRKSDSEQALAWPRCRAGLRDQARQLPASADPVRSDAGANVGSKLLVPHFVFEQHVAEDCAAIEGCEQITFGADDGKQVLANSSF